MVPYIYPAMKVAQDKKNPPVDPKKAGKAPDPKAKAPQPPPKVDPKQKKEVKIAGSIV
jgi:hypothetical protein